MGIIRIIKIFDNYGTLSMLYLIDVQNEFIKNQPISFPIKK
jgi:hypothetical protein